MKPGIPVTIGVVIGAGLWLASRSLVHSPHPFEARSPLLLAALFLAGGALGAAWPERLWTGALGLYLGQGLALLAQKVWLPSSAPSEQAALALLFLVQYSLPSLAGAALGALLADGAGGRLQAWLAGNDGRGRRNSGPIREAGAPPTSPARGDDN